MTRRESRRRRRARQFAADIFSEVIRENDDPQEAYLQASTIVSEDFGSGPIAKLILEFILMLLRSLIEGNLGTSNELEGTKFA